MMLARASACMPKLEALAEEFPGRRFPRVAVELGPPVGWLCNIASAALISTRRVHRIARRSRPRFERRCAASTTTGCARKVRVAVDQDQSAAARPRSQALSQRSTPR